MKKKCIIFVLIFFFIMCILPSAVFNGAKNGLILWFYTLVPTLFPFIVMSNLIIKTNGIEKITKVLTPGLSKIFSVSQSASFAIVAGFICGFPLGAKVISDLIITKRITKKEGQYLLSFCNNVSPMFIASYIVIHNFQDKQLMFPTLLILIMSPVLCSFLFRCYHKPDISQKQKIIFKNDFTFDVVDDAIENGVKSIVNIGGYVILFSIIPEILYTFSFDSKIISLLEITNGIPYLMRHYTSQYTAYIPILSLASFGGLCSLLQTYSIINKVGLKILPYIIEKLITALVTSLISYVFLKLY